MIFLVHTRFFLFQQSFTTLGNEKGFNENPVMGQKIVFLRFVFESKTQGLVIFLANDLTFSLAIVTLCL